MANDESQEQKRGHQRGTDRREDSSSCYANGHTPPQELGGGTEIPKKSKDELYSEETLWRPQRLWILLQDYQDTQDKQLLQYPPLPKSKWRTLQHYRLFLLVRNLYGHPLAGLLWERHIEKSSFGTWMGERTKLGTLICALSARSILVCVRMKLAGKNKNIDSMVKKLMKHLDPREPSSFLDHVYLGCTQREREPNESIVDEHRKMSESRISAAATQKLPELEEKWWKHEFVALRHGRTCEEMCWKMLRIGQQTNWVIALSLYTMPWRSSIQNRKIGTVGESSKVCSQIVLKFLYLARVGRPDILWSVNRLARTVTKRTRPCDKRLARFISYMHHKSEFKQHCHVGNSAQQCGLGLFQGSCFAGDLEDSNSISGGILCLFGSRRSFLLVECARDKTSVSQNSTESEVVSLDAGLRMDCIPALDHWGLIVGVLHSSLNQPRARSNLYRHTQSEKCSNARTKKQSNPSQDLDKTSVDFVTSSAKLSRFGAFFFFEEPTELRLIGCLTESVWPRKSESNMLTPEMNSLTCLPKGISHVKSGIIFFVCSTFWVSRCILVAISVIFFLIRLESRAPCQNE